MAQSAGREKREKTQSASGIAQSETSGTRQEPVMKRAVCSEKETNKSRTLQAGCKHRTFNIEHRMNPAYFYRGCATRSAGIHNLRLK
jgi:hypothetical protein